MEKKVYDKKLENYEKILGAVESLVAIERQLGIVKSLLISDKDGGDQVALQDKKE